MTKTKDMTQGRPWKLILGFSLPLMLGNVFQQLYTFFDTMVVNKALGDTAVAAIGVTHWLVFMMFGFVAGLTQGFSVLMAKRFGAGDYTSLRKAVANSVYLTVAFAIVFTVIGQVVCRPVLILLRTPSEILGMSSTYLGILYAGLPIAFAYNLLAAMLRALGSSRAPLRAIIIASICNIALDVLFVMGFGLGVAGAAYATLIAQLLATLYCYMCLRKIGVLKFHQGERAICLDTIKHHLKLGLPMGFQNTITSLGGMVVQWVVNGFGTLFVAGFTAANKIYGLLETAASSYAYAMNTYTGQNSGAGNHAKVKKGLRSALVIGILTAAIMSCVMFFFGDALLGSLISGEESIAIGVEFLYVLAIFFPLLYVLYIVRACLQGLGNTVVPMVSSIAQMVMRVGCAVGLTALIGYKALFFGEVGAWVGALVVLSLSLSKTIVNVKASDGKVL